ncbi:hypothetical protein GCM10008997_02880 [Halomonas salifodinae]
MTDLPPWVGLPRTFMLTHPSHRLRRWALAWGEFLVLILVIDRLGLDFRVASPLYRWQRYRWAPQDHLLLRWPLMIYWMISTVPASRLLTLRPHALSMKPTCASEHAANG